MLSSFTLGFSLHSLSMRFSPAQVTEGREVQQGPNPTFIRERAWSVPMCSGLYSLPTFHFESISWGDHKTGRHLCIMVIKGHEILGCVKLLQKKK